MLTEIDVLTHNSTHVTVKLAFSCGLTSKPAAENPQTEVRLCKGRNENCILLIDWRLRSYCPVNQRPWHSDNGKTVSMRGKERNLERPFGASGSKAKKKKRKASVKDQLRSLQRVLNKVQYICHEAYK